MESNAHLSPLLCISSSLSCIVSIGSNVSVFFFHQLCCWNHSGDKKLLTPQPRLRTGFFSVLESQMIPTGCIPEACTSVGAAKYGRPIGLDERIKVDLIVIGSVAVDPSTGARLGKGEVIIVEELNQS